jgi:hypothetical protein
MRCEAMLTGRSRTVLLAMISQLRPGTDLSKVTLPTCAPLFLPSHIHLVLPPFLRYQLFFLLPVSSSNLDPCSSALRTSTLTPTSSSGSSSCSFSLFS